MAELPNQVHTSDSQFETIRGQEYGVLREELKINRQFVFERPLLLVGVSFAALASVGKEPSQESAVLQWLILFFLLLLFFNLWFTFNRLSSNSRVLGYLRVVHESTENVLRPGWERALSLQRTWLATNVEKLTGIERECGGLTMHDANRFYGGLFLFHLSMGGLALAFGLLPLAGPGLSYPARLLEAAAVGVYVVGIIVALRSWNPYRPKNSLEIQTRVWREVLRTNGDFYMTKDSTASPSPEAVRAAMDLAWRDHHHARDQTWKALQIEAVLGAGLVSIDAQYDRPSATLGAAILVILAAMFGLLISWHHRKLERRKIIHIYNCEEYLGLHRDDLLPRKRKGSGADDRSAEVVDSAVSFPEPFSWWWVFDIRRTNTALFIMRMHFAIIAFAIIVVVARYTAGDYAGG